MADVETDGFLPELTRVWCLAIADPRSEEVEVYADQPGYTPLVNGLARLKEADRVVFHNGLGFDFWAINKVYPGTLRFDQIYDTLVVSRLADPESKAHSLAAWGERMGFPKSEYLGDFQSFDDDLATYCGRDAQVGARTFRCLWKATRDWGEAVELEHRVRFVIALQEQNGFTLDIEAAQALEAELRQEQTDCEHELQKVFKPQWLAKVAGKQSVLFRGWDDMERAVKTPKVGKPAGKSKYVKGAPYCSVEYVAFNPGSKKHVEGWLRQRGWKPRKFTDGGAAKLDATTIQEIAILVPEIKPLARYARVSKQLGQLADGDNSWLKMVTPEGRVHGHVNTNGAVTGRMTHYQPNLANVDKKDLRMRAVWIPRDGWDLVGTDAEGLELRMLAHYLKPYDGGAFERMVLEGSKEDGTDVHSVNQRTVGLYKRDNAKRVIYALIYGAGDMKIGLIVIEDADEAGKPRPKGSPSAIGKKAREDLVAGIVGLSKLLTKVQRAHRKNKYLRGLDGRRVYTRSAHSALNSLLQSGGAIVMKKALALWHFDRAVTLELVDPGTFLVKGDWAYCANVHDEVQNECDPDLSKIIGQGFADSITQAGIELGVRCPLAGTFDVGENWKATH